MAKRTKLIDFFGKWPGDEKEIERIKSELEKERESFTLTT